MDPSHHDAMGVGRPVLLWMYLLVPLPLVTDLIETGRWPSAPREWLTEVVVGALIAALVQRVRREHVALLAMARTDPLTGLGNRRAFEEALDDECVRARRLGQPLSLVCLDLDHFKQVNDHAGHAAGDLVLRQLADAIRAAARARLDRGFRLGGDEFALLLPGGSAAQASAVLERIRIHCGQADAAWREGRLGVSAGVAEIAEQESPADFARRADRAMYADKLTRRAALSAEP